MTPTLGVVYPNLALDHKAAQVNVAVLHIAPYHRLDAANDIVFEYNHIRIFFPLRQGAQSLRKISVDNVIVVR